MMAMLKEILPQAAREGIGGLYLVVTNLPSTAVDQAAAKIFLSQIKDLYKEFLPHTAIVNVIHFGGEPGGQSTEFYRVMAQAGRGRYHAVRVDDKGVIDHVQSDDLTLLDAELELVQKALGLLKTKEQEQLRLASAPAKAPTELKKKPAGPALQRNPLPPAHSQKPNRTQKLRLQPHLTDRHFIRHLKEVERLRTQQIGLGSSAEAISAMDIPPAALMSSAQWLNQNGLQARQLTIYQVLGDVAYTTAIPGTYVGEAFKSMATLPWKDGTARTVHVDPAQLILYRKALLAAFRLYNERIRWLGTGSRRLWGNLAEEVVTIVLDVPWLTMHAHRDKLRRHLELLFLEQLPHKKWFNVVKVTAQPQKWAPNVMATAPAILQEAWEWICSALADDEPDQGDLLAALTLACDELRPQLHGVHGIYLVTDGSGFRGNIADELSTYLQSLIGDGRGTLLHCCAYNAHGVPTAAPQLRELAHRTGGRFSLCLDNGTVFDEKHATDRSWTIDPGSLQEIEHSLCGPSAGNRAAKQTSKAYSLLCAWFAQQDRDHEAVWEQGGVKAGPSTTTATRLCACYGDDVVQLHEELAEGQKHLSLLDTLIHSLSVDYADAAVALAQGAKVPLPPTPALLEHTLAPTALPEDEASSAGSKMAPLTEAALRETLKPRAPALSTKPPACADPLHGRKPPARKARAVLPSAVPAQPPASSRKGRFLAIQSPGPGLVSKGLPVDPVYLPGPAPPAPKTKAAPTWPPNTEKVCSSKAWLRCFGLKRLQLDLDGFTKDHVLVHAPKGVPESDARVGARFCDIFPLDLPGKHDKDHSTDACRHVLIPVAGWNTYMDKLRVLVKRYKKRLQWLQTGSRRVFGCLLESNVALAIDTSGSMVASMPFLQQRLGQLIEEQVRVQCKLFNVVQFATTVLPWTDCLIDVDDDTCAGAAAWVQTLTCGGGTNILGALECALQDPFTEGIYLLSDGLPEESCEEVLDKTAALIGDRKVAIHTISFNCVSRQANEFLRRLAASFHGRFHFFERLPLPGDSCIYDPQSECASYLQVPDEGMATGDDISGLQREVERAEFCIQQAIKYREQLQAHAEEASSIATVESQDGTPRWNESLTSKRRQQQGSMTSFAHLVGNDATSETPAPPARIPEPKETRSSQLLRQAASLRLNRTPTASRFTAWNDDCSGSGSKLASSESSEELEDEHAFEDERDAAMESLPLSIEEDAVGLVQAAPLPVSTVDATPTNEHQVTATGLVYPKRSVVAPRVAAAPAVTGYRAFCSNLSREVDEEGLRHFFSLHSVRVAAVDVPWNTHTRSYQGIAYIKFDARKHLLRALQLNGAVLRGQNMCIQLAAGPAVDSDTLESLEGLLGVSAVSVT